MHCMVLTSFESDQYFSTQKKISKLPLKYMTGYVSIEVKLLQVGKRSSSTVVLHWFNTIMTQMILGRQTTLRTCILIC